MIRVTRRRVLLAVLALILIGVGTVAWTLAGLPPPLYYLRYGFDPYCEPTGARETYEGVEFIEIGPGIFRMGSGYLGEGGDWLGKICAPLGLPWGKRPDRYPQEVPPHWVEFRRGYWIATTEITNAQYERFAGRRERRESWEDDDTPVVWISWDEARDYCAWLAVRSGRAVHLPSEAEWECACRAGSMAAYTFGDDEKLLSEYAWHDREFEDGLKAVATKRPNRWGLFDLHGNVWEWCEDTWHESYHGAPADGSPWVDEGSYSRVRRGASQSLAYKDCRSALRGCFDPGEGGWDLGFRPAISNPAD